ncbi:MAG TPA: hypothetical protein VF427_08855 [Noviherbaspirillum sp.]
MGIKTTDCPVQIQIWVDDNAVQTGSTAGVYLVDNRVASGSEAEGTSSLSTASSLNSNICWQVFLINSQSTANASIQSIGNSQAWGFSGQPERAPDNSLAFTGTAQNAGTFTYPLSINLQVAGGSGTTINLTPSVVVSAS